MEEEEPWIQFNYFVNDVNNLNQKIINKILVTR